MENWESLLEKGNPPLSIYELKKHVNLFKRYIRSIKDRNLDTIKENLLNARGELDKMISIILNYMKKEDVTLKREVNDIIYEEFTINFQGLMKMVDLEQDTQFVKVDNKYITDVSRLIAFKIFLETCYFDVIFLPLKLAIENYQENKNDDEFYYNWFAKVACVLKVKAGIRREGIKSSIFRGKGQYLPYSMLLQDLSKKDDSSIETEFKDTFEKGYEEEKEDKLEFEDELG